jgi:broad-specificity NMP kinase
VLFLGETRVPCNMAAHAFPGVPVTAALARLASRPSLTSPMFNICPACGLWADAPAVDPVRDHVACPHCGSDRPLRRLPLFVVTGASGVGKSTVCEHLAPALADTVCLEADTLWGHVPATAADGPGAYWNVWLDLAVAIHQSGRPVALFGTTVPEHLEECPARPLLRAVHYLALVLDPAELARRLRERPAWRGCSADLFVAEMVQFDGWLRAHAAETRPPMTVLDVTGQSIAETRGRVAEWIRALR